MLSAVGTNHQLSFRGGTAGALAPFVLFLAGVAWLGVSGAPDERGFWAVLVAALALVLAASTTQGGPEHGMPRLTALSAGLWNLHSWMLLAVILTAVLTGWGRNRQGAAGG